MFQEDDGEYYDGAERRETMSTELKIFKGIPLLKLRIA